jgi:hypothetical protein
LGVTNVKNLIWRLFVALKKTNAIDDFLSQTLMEMRRGQEEVTKDDF